MDFPAHSPLLGQKALKLILQPEQLLFYQIGSHHRLKLFSLEIHEPSVLVSKWICQKGQRLLTYPE